MNGYSITLTTIQLDTSVLYVNQTIATLIKQFITLRVKYNLTYFT